jgi:hypothetical protein
MKNQLLGRKDMQTMHVRDWNEYVTRQKTGKFKSQLREHLNFLNKSDDQVNKAKEFDGQLWIDFAISNQTNISNLFKFMEEQGKEWKGWEDSSRNRKAYTLEYIKKIENIQYSKNNIHEIWTPQVQNIKNKEEFAKSYIQFGE